MTDDRVLELQGLRIGNDAPFVLFGGMNVLESRERALEVAGHYAEVTQRLGIPWVFKASFDKANRSSLHSWRGPGLDAGRDMLSEIRQRFGCAVMTDVHEPGQADPAAEVADVLQVPAFLARQTDLVAAVARTGRIINIKKPQFLAPGEMGHILNKAREAGNERLMLCERGSQFGYNNLVVDMLGFDILKSFGYPVLFDVTHALQMPGAGGGAAGGRRHQIASLARAGMSQGLAGLFLEAHPEPDEALCDGPSALRLDRLEPFLQQIKTLDEQIKALPSFDNP